MIRQLHRIAVFIACMIFATAVSAGSSCEERKIGPDELRKAMQLGHKTRQVAEAADARVALVGRVGADLSAHGLRYSHMGALLRDHPKGRWIFVHALNNCGSASSAIYDEGLANFFLDDPFEYEAVVLVPSADLQRRLADTLLSPYVVSLHQSSYNMIAHPRSLRYQNSNQWVLELLAAAHGPAGAIASRSEAQAYLEHRGFSGDPIAIPPLKRLGARLFRANVRLEEHEENGAYGVYETVTVRSVARFLEKIDAVQVKRVVSLERPDREPVRY